MALSRFRPHLPVGTRSLLWGVHSPIVHTWTIARAWRQIYGSYPRDLRIWVAFLVHDLGYWGCTSMDGKDGKAHPWLGARVMHTLFDSGWRDLVGLKPPVWTARQRWGWEWVRDHRDDERGRYLGTWGRFALFHSRSLVRLINNATTGSPWRASKLCAADKVAMAVYPEALYLLLARLSGELREYMQEAATPAGQRLGLDVSSPRAWYRSVSEHLLRVGESTKQGNPGVPPGMEVA